MNARTIPTAADAVEVAAAGGHHMLVVGRDDDSRVSVATRLHGLLPPLDRDQVDEVARIRSAAWLAVDEWYETAPPFQVVQSSVTMVGLYGGATASLRPGRVSLAHRGVLVLRELPDFAPVVLDALRQPLEERVVRVARARASVVFPAAVQVVATMPRCPCDGDLPTCRCGVAALTRFRRRISGPVLDRLALRIDLDGEGEVGGPVLGAAERVAQARRVAADRGALSEHLRAGHRGLEGDGDAEDALAGVLRVGRVSARGALRARRVARTIADLSGVDGPLRGGDVDAALALTAPPL